MIHEGLAEPPRPGEEDPAEELARQLKLQAPQIDVAVIEKSEKTNYKVGESTIELATEETSGAFHQRA